MTRQRRDLLIIAVLVATYVAITGSLAVTTDRGFFLTDAVYLGTWVLFGLGLAATGLFAARRRR